MNKARGASEWADTYGSGFGIPAGARLLQVPLDLLDPWTDAAGNTQPFRSYTPAELEDLADNIRQNGVITPIHVRPLGRRFQILAGHNRSAAARMAGLTTIPAIVQETDDNAAAVILVDSNLKQRDKILASEKAYAYKLKLDAMKRQGKRTDLTSCQNGTKLPEQKSVTQQENEAELTSCQNGTKLAEARADQKLSKNSTDSARQIQRYIRLTYLIPSLLDLVDKGKLKLVAGSDISFLPQNIQELLADLMINEGIKVSTAKAANLKQLQPKSELELRAILEETPKSPSIKVTLSMPELDAIKIAELNRNAEFQDEAQEILAGLVKRYLAEKSE